MRSALFWDFTQRRMIVCYRRFGTTYRPCHQVSRSRLLDPWRWDPIGCPETSVTNYLSTLRKLPEEWRSQLHNLFSWLMVKSTTAVPRSRRNVNGKFRIKTESGGSDFSVYRISRLAFCYCGKSRKRWSVKSSVVNVPNADKAWYIISKYSPHRFCWPFGLKRSYVASLLLGLRVRIPLRAWMFVSCGRCVLCR
jgi:hypothetical protein